MSSLEPPPSSKEYNRAYFDRWYRSGERIGSPASLKRKVTMAVSITEFLLDRPVRSVLDVGCGEGRWQPVLSKLRPKASYLGIDSSQYAVERFGDRRNLRLGTFEDLELHAFDYTFDLVVCSDVLHYLTRKQIEKGLPALSRLVGGAALLEAFSKEDDTHVEGDHVGFKNRRAATYRKLFWDAGLVPCGMQMYVHRDDLPDMVALEVFP